MKRWMVVLMTGVVAVSLHSARAEWYDDMKFKGDVRYRFENINDDSRDSQQQRDRIRARLGVFPRVNNELDVGLQIATGTEVGNKEDPTSSNTTMTDGFSGKGIFLDLAYFDWHPEVIKGADLIGGKMKNPFITVGDYIWDGDVTPEGLAAKYHVGKDVELLANAGYLWVYERSAAADTKLYGVQGALKYHFNSDAHVMVGASGYLYDNMEGFDVIDWSGAKKTYGNSKVSSVSGTTTNSLYAMEYTELEGFAEVAFKLGLPVTLFGSYVVNTEAEEDDTGYMLGGAIGKAKDPKSFEVGYNYRRLEKDAAVGAFVDSDSWGGGTDGQGHKLYGKYQIHKNWQAGISYFINDKKLDDSVNYERLQVDLVASF